MKRQKNNIPVHPFAQEFLWPSGSDQRSCEEDEGEESFLIEIEEIEDAIDADYSDDGSPRQ